MEHLKPARREAFQKHPSFDFSSKPYVVLNPQFTTKPTPVNCGPSASYHLEPKNQIHTIQNHNLGGLRAPEDSEISIFDARKYFNVIDDPKVVNKHISNTAAASNPKPSDASSSSIARFSSVSSIDDGSGYGGVNFRARSFRSTPTSYSEASWNSQTGLLANPPGSVAVSIRNITADKTGNKASGAVTKFLRGTKCPCSGRKSVQVEQSLTSESEHGKTTTVGNIARMNRSNSSGSTSLYSSTRQSSPRLLPSYPPVSATASPKTKIQLLPPSTDATNFILRPTTTTTTLDQTTTKLPSSSVTTNPMLNGGFQPQKPFTPDRITISARSFTDGNGTTSNGFTFPVLNSNNNNSNPQGKRSSFNLIRPPLPAIVDPPRDSLEVFQPRDSDINVVKPNGAEVKDHRCFALPVSPRSRRTSYDDEACSEASSDLFEIESFSTHAASYPHRDSLDDPSAFNVRRFQIATAIDSSNAAFRRRSMDEETTEMYEPSEVSVDWSVTTAEGFDRASLTNFSVSASEIGYAAMKRAAEAEEAARRRSSGGEGRSKAGNGGVGLSLMNCRCEKAVSVGPKPVKCAEENGPTGLTWGHVSGRVQAHEKPPHSNKRHGQTQAHLINVGKRK